MSNKVALRLLVLLFCVRPAAFGQGGAAGNASAGNPDNAASRAHIQAAKSLAGNDAFLLHPYNFFCIPANTRANNPNAPELEPVRLFDNVYAVGNSETAVYAIATSDGIVLIDSGYADRVESVVVAGLQKLGLDPAKVKYVLLGHGHADHFGGARYFQDHYGARVGAAAADWDLIDPPPPANPNPNANAGPPRPKRDLILSENQPLKVGNLTVTSIAIPGHTPGSLAIIFPILDKGTTRPAGIFGGTVLTLNRLTPDVLRQYTQSIAHYLEVVRDRKVQVELQNHPIFDGMADKLIQLKSMKSGPNPLVVGTDRYIRMWKIVSECVQAEISRRTGNSD